MQLPIGTILAFFISLLTIFVDCFPKQFTFELPGTEQMCFYEKLDKGEQYSFMFQVLKGPTNDLEVIITNPLKKVVFSKTEASHENFEFTADMNGDYSVCFRNEHSPMSPKRILIELRGEDTLREEAGFPDSGPVSMIEALAESIHEHLSISSSYQTELRAKLTTDRIFAHELRSHISIWSSAVSAIIVLTVLAQVSILKSFFKNKDRLYTMHGSH
ncbi:hypothetical protein Aperf_G00000081020 [Anoplocephala perfoliata]